MDTDTHRGKRIEEIRRRWEACKDILIPVTSHSKEVLQDSRDGVNDSASKTGQVTRKGGHWGAPGMAGIHWELGGELSLQREGVMGTKEGGNF